MMMAALTMATDFTTWDAYEPQYSQLPFFSPSLKSMVAAGTFFKCDNRIPWVVSHEQGTKIGGKSDMCLVLNKFIALQNLGITQAPIVAGTGREHVEVVQTPFQLHVSDASTLQCLCLVFGRARIGQVCWW